MKKKEKTAECIILLGDLLDQEGDYLQAHWMYT